MKPDEADAIVSMLEQSFPGRIEPRFRKRLIDRLGEAGYDDAIVGCDRLIRGGSRFPTIAEVLGAASQAREDRLREEVDRQREEDHQRCASGQAPAWFREAYRAAIADFGAGRLGNAEFMRRCRDIQARAGYPSEALDDALELWEQGKVRGPDGTIGDVPKRRGGVARLAAAALRSEGV